MSAGLFITATGTEVGKTYVAALLVKKLRAAGLKAGYYKAALSGAEWVDGRLLPGDADYVKRVADIDQPLETMVSYIYERAVSPHLAARLEGPQVEMEQILHDYRQVKERYDYVTVEGSGGIVCPLRGGEKKLMLTDVIGALKLPALLVAPAGLGSINSTVLTAEYAARNGIKIAGIILNNFHPGDCMEEDNRLMIEELTGLAVLAQVEPEAGEMAIEVTCLTSLYE